MSRSAWSCWGYRTQSGDLEFAPPSSWVMFAVGTLRASQAERWVCSSTVMMQRWQGPYLPPQASAKFCQLILTQQNSYWGPGNKPKLCDTEWEFGRRPSRAPELGPDAGFVQAPLIHFSERRGAWSHLETEIKNRRWLCCFCYIFLCSFPLRNQFLQIGYYLPQGERDCYGLTIHVIWDS